MSFKKETSEGQIPVEPEQSNLSQFIVGCLENLFPNKKILPYNIPAFLQGVVKVNCVNNAEAEVDVNISELFSTLNKTALELMNSSEAYALAKAKQILESLALLQPDNSHVFYNLACVESLMKNEQQAVAFLKEAFNRGYQNFEHMVNDPDLLYVRASEQWKEVLNSFKQVKQEPVVLNTNAQKEAKPQVEVEVSKPIEEIAKPIEEVAKPIEEVAKPIEEVAKPIEEVVKPIEVAKPPPARWGEQIQTLHSMGFNLDESILIDLLDHHKGSIANALPDIL